MEDTMRDSDANTAQENLQRMKTLDDAWNSQNWEVFRKRHAADTKVYWPGQPDPTTGRDAHHHESEAFFKSIENHLENGPLEGTRWQSSPANEQHLRAGVLHRRAVEERRNRRGEAFLRSGEFHASNRNPVIRRCFSEAHRHGTHEWSATWWTPREFRARQPCVNMRLSAINPVARRTRV